MTFATSIWISIETAMHRSTRFGMSAHVPAPNFVSTLRPASIKSYGKSADSIRMRRKSLLRGLANQFGGDTAATDSTRVLRLPGFVNRKLSEEFIVQARQESNSSTSFVTSQSTKDARGRRARSRARPRRRCQAITKASPSATGLTPSAPSPAATIAELVIRTIADYRSEDKADPNYYARRTVTKARAELDQEPSKSK